MKMYPDERASFREAVSAADHELGGHAATRGATGPHDSQATPEMRQLMAYNRSLLTSDGLSALSKMLYGNDREFVVAAKRLDPKYTGKPDSEILADKTKI